MSTIDIDSECRAIAGALAGVVVALSKRVRLRLATTGIDLTPDQFWLLDALASQAGQLTQSELAELQDKDKSVLLRQIDVLEAQGLSARVTSSEDRRKKLLALTPRGRRLHAKARAAVEELLRELYSDLPAQRLQSIRKGLEEMHERTQSFSEPSASHSRSLHA